MLTDKPAVDRVLACYTGERIHRYQKQKLCSIFEAKKAIADICIDEALKHVVTARDLAKIIQFQRRNT